MAPFYDKRGNTPAEEALRRSLLPGSMPMLPDHRDEQDSSEKAGESLSGGSRGWRRTSPTSDKELERAKALIRPNVQEVVGTAWARWMLDGPSDASIVDWISAAITDKLADEPEFFQGGRR